MGENNKTEKKKGKPSLAMQIFLALVLAIICGLLLQNHSEFAEHYIKPFGTIFLNLVKFIVVPVRHYFDAGYPEGRFCGNQDGGVLSLYHCFRSLYRTVFWKPFPQIFSGYCHHEFKL